MTSTEPAQNDSVQAVTGVPFTLNGAQIEAEEGELLIDACDRNGIHIPRFCYHNRMKPVGMCRMCLVEVDTGRGPSLQPSCMLPVTPEMKVETESEETKAAQDGVLELLLANHPLDCPVCDKGGECPLQDNAYAYGPGDSRFVEEKRHFEKPIPISDLVQLDRERCILCDRCTRFASDVAGDPLIHFINRGSQTEVNTFPDHPFSSYFSGNTVQICPVGALTATPYRFKARPWDVTAIESTSAVDGTGARIVLQSTQDELIRVLGVDSEAVNWSWLTDKDRFSYQANSSEDRISEPLLRNSNGKIKSKRWVETLAAAGEALRVDPEKIGVIGGSRLSLESQYAWSKLTKGIIGTDNVDAQLGDGLPASLTLGLPKATIAETCAPGGVIVLMAPDPKEDLGTLYLRIRHAVVEDGAKLVEITPRATSLTPFASLSIRVAPGEVGSLIAGLSKPAGNAGPGNSLTEEDRQALTEFLTGDDPVSVLFGRANLAESSRYAADALGALHRLNPNAKFLPSIRRSNLNGALEMGLTPGFLPGGVRSSEEVSQHFAQSWPVLPEADGKDTAGILRAAADGKIETLILLGADPIEDFPDAEMAKDAFDNVANIIAVDCFITASSDLAQTFLPATMQGESDGTFCNIEGRLSPLRAKVTAPGQARPDWVIAAELANTVGPDIGFATIEELRSEMSSIVSGLNNFEWDAMSESDDGPLMVNRRNWELDFGAAASAPPAADGYRMVVDRKLWDLGTIAQKSEAMRDLCEPGTVKLNPEDVELLQLNTTGAGLESSEADEAFVLVEQGEDSFKLRFVADPTVAPKTVWLPMRLAGFDVRQLLSVSRTVTTVTLRKAEAE